jgi:hypothetical protein
MPNIYLHDNERIRDRREELKYSRKKLSKKLSELSEEVGRTGIFDISRTRIARIEGEESGELSLREAIAITTALNFLRIGEIINKDHHEILKSTEIGTYAHLHDFADERMLFSYLREIEADGRIGIYHSFPSSTYTTEYRTNVSQEELKRANKIILERVTSQEYYTIKSLLLFAFSEVGQFTDKDKGGIIENMINAFSHDRQMRLCFYDNAYLKLGPVPNMEIIKLRSLVIIDTPKPNCLLEIKNDKVVEVFDSFFRDKRSFIRDEANIAIEEDDAIFLLKMIGEYIKEGGQLATGFYKQCKEQWYADLILNQLNPSLREEISKST